MAFQGTGIRQRWKVAGNSPATLKFGFGEVSGRVFR